MIQPTLWRKPLQPQTRAVLELLQLMGSAGVTPLLALEAVGTFRLGARIFDLRAAGYEITSELVTLASGKRVAKYRLVP